MILPEQALLEAPDQEIKALPEGLPPLLDIPHTRPEADPQVREILRQLSQAQTVAEIKFYLLEVKKLQSTVYGHQVDSVLQPILDAQKMLISTADSWAMDLAIELIPLPEIQDKCKKWLREAREQVMVVADPKASTRQIFDALSKMVTLGYTELLVFKRIPGEESSVEELVEKRDILEVLRALQPIGQMMDGHKAMSPTSQIEQLQTYQTLLNTYIESVPYADNIDLKVYYDAMQLAYKPKMVSRMPEHQVPERLRQRFKAYVLDRERL